MKVLAIDVGASSGRCIVLSYKEGTLLQEETYRFKNQMVWEDNHYRWDMTAIMNHIYRGLQISMEKHSDIESIGIDTWAVDYVLLDENGKILHNPIAYRDIRNQEAAETLLATVPYEIIYKKTGIQYLPFNTIFQLYAEEQQQREYATFLMIPDYIGYCLTGKKGIEITNLSTTALYNPMTKKIEKDLLNLLRIEDEKIPQVFEPYSYVGDLRDEIRKEFQLYACKVVRVGSHDTASAIAGVSLSSEMVYLSSGTWSLLGVELKEPRITNESFQANFTNEVGLEHSIRFLKNIMGMFIIQEYKKDLEKKGFNYSYQELQELAIKAKENMTYIDVNHSLFQQPEEMEEKLFTFLKTTNQNTTLTHGEMIKMIYESMALKYREEFQLLKKVLNKDYQHCLVFGGGSQVSILNQMIADALECDVYIGEEEATVLGNAMAQWIAGGVFKNLAEARGKATKIREVIKPLNKEKFNEKYKQYKKICGGTNESRK